MNCTRLIIFYCISIFLGFLGKGIALGELVFDKQAYSATSGLNEMKMRFEFPFTNKSPAEVTIKKVETSCSCLTAALLNDKEKIASGEKSAVFLDIDLGAFGGKIDKYAIVVTSEGERIPLNISVSIPDFLKMEPRTLKWTVGESLTPKTIHFIIHPSLTLKLKEVSISSPNFEFTPKVITPGKEYALEVTPKSTATPDYGMIRVHTDSAIPRYKRSVGFLSIDTAQSSTKKK